MKRAIPTFSLLLALLLAGASASAYAAVEVSDGELYGRPVKILDNGLLRLGVTPQIGARVLALVDKRTGHDHVQIAEWFIGLEPDDEWLGAEYGGITDMESDGWPGLFWGTTYELTTETGEDGGVTLVATGEAGGVRAERRMTMWPDSTRLRVRLKLTNISDYTRPLAVRIHGELRLGERADDNDHAYWIAADGSPDWMRYILGNEKNGYRNGYRVRQIQARGWFGMVDLEDGAALIAVYDEAEPPTRISWWGGFNMGDPEDLERDETNGFFNFDMIGPREKVPAGEAIEGGEDYWILQGLRRRIWRMTDRFVLAGDSLRLPAVYGRDEPIGALVQIGSHAALNAPLRVEAELRKAGAAEALQRRSAQADGIPLGGAADFPLRFDAKGREDGEYEILVSLTAGGEAAGTFRIPLTVESAAVDGVLARRDATADTFAARSKDIDTLPEGLPRSTGRIIGDAIRLQMKRVEARLDEADFEGANLLLAEVETSLARLAELTASASAAKGAETDASAALPALLSEWKAGGE